MLVPGTRPVMIETYLLAEHRWVPNNARLPVILYRHAISVGSCEDTASAFEKLFAHHGWPAQWRDGIYDYHHYHSTAHEVLGVACGSALLMIGGPDGREMTVAAGDALLLPTGTGHCALGASEDFLVVGAYPEDQRWDICRDAPDKEARKRMGSLPFPSSDPIHGANGPLTDHWR
ncbi:MAG: cupin [Sphingobium sp.]